jgi:hypothetical protein
MRIVSRSLGQLVTRGNGWTYFGSIYPDIQAEEAIREMTTAALLTLLIGGFQVWGMGAIGLDLSLAAIIINFFVGLMTTHRCSMPFETYVISEITCPPSMKIPITQIPATPLLSRHG